MSDYIAEQYAKQFTKQLLDSSDYLLDECIATYMESDALELSGDEYNALVDSVRSILDTRIIITIK